MDEVCKLYSPKLRRRLRRTRRAREV